MMLPANDGEMQFLKQQLQQLQIKDLQQEQQIDFLTKQLRHRQLVPPEVRFRRQHLLSQHQDLAHCIWQHAIRTHK